jgi:hypothetical protein
MTNLISQKHFAFTKEFYETNVNQCFIICLIINFVSNIQSVYINVVTTMIPPRTFVDSGTILAVVRIIVSVFSTEGLPIMT